MDAAYDPARRDKNLRTLLGRRAPKILQIDDRAGDGWSDIFVK